MFMGECAARSVREKERRRATASTTRLDSPLSLSAAAHSHMDDYASDVLLANAARVARLLARADKFAVGHVTWGQCDGASLLNRGAAAYLTPHKRAKRALGHVHGLVKSR